MLTLIESFSRRAIQEGFVLQDHSSQQHHDGTAATFSKFLGNDLCIVRLYDGDRLNAADFLQAEALWNGDIFQHMEAHGLRNVILTHIFLHHSQQAQFQPVVDGGEEYLNQPVYNIYWSVDLDQPEGLAVNPNQPNGIGRVMDILKDSLREYHHEMPTEGQGRLLNDARYAPRAKRPVLTYGLMALNGVMFIATFLLGGLDNDTLLRLGALEPVRVFQYGEYYRLFTVMLLHGGIAHFASNCLGLYIFGTRVERYYGHGVFLAIYVFSGFMGSLASLMSLTGFAVGASGAIYGLIGAAAARTLVTRRALDGLPLYFFFLYGIFSLPIGFLIPNIDNGAHIGGFLAGGLLGYIWTILTPVPRKEVALDE